MSIRIGSLKDSFNATVKNEEIFRSLYDDAPLGYHSLDENGHYIIVNDTFANMLGMSKSEMVGKHFSDFMTDESSVNMSGKFKAFKERGSVDVIFEMRHRKGHTIPVRFMGKIAYKSDGEFKQTHCILMDISNEVEYQKGIIQSKERLEDIINLTAEGIYTLDKEGNCLSINQKALELLEYDSEEAIIGKNMHKLIHHSKPNGEVIELNDCAASEAQLNGRSIVKSKENFWKNNGLSFEVSYNSSPIISNGELLGSLVSFRDNTINTNIVNSLVNMSYHDTLTGVFNRRYYEEEIKNIDVEKNYPLSIIVSDINGLKLVNDAFGHYAGDKLLISATEVFTHHARNNDFIARLGGDEFAIIMPNTNHKEVENRVKDMIESCKNYNVKAVKLSVSFGFKTKVDSSVAFDEVYKSAEDSMYRMKLLDVPSMRSNTIDTIIRTLYETDQYSEEHSRSVSKICEAIAIKHHLPFQQINEIKMAGVLHDIGKIVISKKIINKNGELTKKEYDEIKSHSEIGFRILNSSTELRQLSTTVLSHHEHWDGKGYPQNLKGEQIPLLSRIISVADAFDAMTSDRTYREKISPSNAILEINRCSGTQFDPKVVKTFTENFDAILELSKTKIYEQ